MLNTRLEYSGRWEIEYLNAKEDALNRNRFIPGGFRNVFLDIINQTESPIERPLLPWLCFQQWVHGDRLVAMPCLQIPRWLNSGGTAIVVQVWIQGYRVDIAIVSRMVIEQPKLVLVEIDGAYHQDPKQQMRDKLREKILRAAPNVLGLIRLTGAEVNANPRAAARKVAEYHAKVWGRESLPPDIPFSCRKEE